MSKQELIMNLPATFPTICPKTMKKVIVPVEKSKSTTDSFTAVVTTKIGGTCPVCGQLHTSTITDMSASKYAPVYPTAAAQVRMTSPDIADQTDPQRESAL